MLPDTQFYSERLPEYFHDQTRWVADHGAEENVVFVTHVGDIVNNGDERPEEWEGRRRCHVQARRNRAVGSSHWQP